MTSACEVSVPIGSDIDIITARQKGRTLAIELGFSRTDVVRIAAAISELARNVLSYAGCGEIQFLMVDNGATRGMTILTRDNGPGIANPDRAMEDGYSTSGRLGLGLPGVRRLVDELRVDSTAGAGTTVMATKWCWSA